MLTLFSGALFLSGCTTHRLLARGPYRPVSPLPPGPILDIHCHAGGIGAGDSGCYVSPKLRRNFRFRFYLKSFGVTEKELLAQGDGLVVKRIAERLAQCRHVGAAIVLALDGVVDDKGNLDLARTEVYVPNEFVARETAKYQNLFFGASINPYRTDALPRLEWAHAHGARLVKWLPSIQKIDPAGERLIPFYERLAELKLPLLTHTGAEYSFTRTDDALADPERLRLPLRLGVTVITAHIAAGGTNGGERNTDRLRRLMAEYPNLYADIAALTLCTRPGYLREALQRPEFAGRLLYGSDYPLINTVLVSPWYRPFNLTWRQMREISRLRNPWDRDVMLKHELGVPTDVFANRLFPPG